MRKTLILLLVVMILIQSCSSGGGQVRYDSDTNYRKGSSGVRMLFVQNTPPLETIEDSFLQIGIDLHNDGAYNVENGFLTINYDEDYLELFTTKSKKFDLEGRNKYNKDGEQQNYFYDARTELLESQSQTHNVPILASICYQYQTIVDELICVAKNYDTSKEQGDDLCKYKTYSSGGQGAPVVISSITPTILPVTDVSGEVKAYFDIEITHRNNGGMVLDYDNYLSACSSGSLNDINLVQVKASLSDVPLSCIDGGTDTTVTLRDGYARVRCSSTETIRDVNLPYEAPLYVELNYGYMNTLAQSLTIKRG